MTILFLAKWRDGLAGLILMSCQIGKESWELGDAAYRNNARRFGDSTGNVRTLALGSPSGSYQWRPDRARAWEYVADCERIGRQALRRLAWKGRLKVFEIYFLRDVEYRRAISLVGAAPGTFDNWSSEVKCALGHECSRTGLFPPAQYFRT
jgi:hypothetical protein